MWQVELCRGTRAWGFGDSDQRYYPLIWRKKSSKSGKLWQGAVNLLTVPFQRRKREVKYTAEVYRAEPNKYIHYTTLHVPPSYRSHQTEPWCSLFGFSFWHEPSMRLRNHQHASPSNFCVTLRCARKLHRSDLKVQVTPVAGLDRPVFNLGVESLGAPSAGDDTFPRWLMKSPVANSDHHWIYFLSINI